MKNKTSSRAAIHIAKWVRQRLEATITPSTYFEHGSRTQVKECSNGRRVPGSRGGSEAAKLVVVFSERPLPAS